MSTNLNKRAHDVTQEIFDIMGVRPSGTQGDKVAQAIEQVIVKALKKSAERSTDAATKFFPTTKTWPTKLPTKLASLTMS
jgi:hypothetical protein